MLEKTWSRLVVTTFLVPKHEGIRRRDEMKVALIAELVHESPLPPEGVLKAVLFDVDGTLADSDPLHYLAFREILHEVGFNGGEPINEDFFKLHISGRHNPDIGADLFPDWSEEKRMQLLDEKEARFRNAIGVHVKPTTGLAAFCEWVKQKGLRRAAVTNAPRANAELMIEGLGLTEFFDILVVGSECTRAKPFPDPYQKALDYFGIRSTEAMAVEDSAAGASAAVAAGVATIGLLTANPEASLRGAGCSLVIKDFEDKRLWRALQVE